MKATTGEIGNIERDVSRAASDHRNAAFHPYLKASFELRIIPQLRKRAMAEELSEAEYESRLRFALEVFIDFHEASHGYGAYDKGRPKHANIWAHRQLNAMRSGDPSRGFAIDRAALLDVASRYVAKPEIQCDALDWYFMDTLVFAELDSFNTTAMEGFGGFNLAWVFAEYVEWKYYLYKLLFGVLFFALRYLAIPVIAYFCAVKDYGTTAISILGVWGLYLILRVISIPARWKARRLAIRLSGHLAAAYAFLGQTVIPPARFQAALSEGAKDGVVYDGALFAIADRVARTHQDSFMPWSSDGNN